MHEQSSVWKKGRPRCYTESPTVTMQDTFWPHQLHWGDQEMVAFVGNLSHRFVVFLFILQVMKAGGVRDWGGGGGGV